MKLYKKIMCSAALVLAMTGFQSCSEEKATLEGANTIYIEMTPKDITMNVGDTVYVSAVVSNESGDVINTPITWSVDDESVAKLVDVVTYKKKGSKAEEGEPEGDQTEGEGEEGGEDPNAPGDLDPENPEVPEPEAPEMIEEHRWALVGQIGAQNKSTFVRATLENGEYGVAMVSVTPRDLSTAVAPLTTFKRSYARTMNDTVWFSVTPFALVDEAELKFEMKMTECVTHDTENGDEFKNPRLFIDREFERVGVVYTGPRMTGKGECSLWLEDGELSSNVATLTIHNYPLIWPGFEVDGKRPTYGPPSPSNIKVTLMTTTMDINSTFDVGVCLGIDQGGQQDIDNVIEAEKAGFMKWTVDGSAVVVEDAYIDENYESGYVSYLRVRSGQRPGLSVIKFFMPDTTLTCNLTVDDYDNSYPVDRIVVKQNGEETDHVTFELGQPANIEVSVEPEVSFTFHTPEITVADPSIVDVQPQDPDAGYTRSFTVKTLGETSMTITSLDKTVTIPITVIDHIDGVLWDQTNPSEIIVGTPTTIKAEVRYASGKAPEHDVEWTVSDPEKLKITPTGEIGVAVIEGIAEGEVQIFAEYEGVRSAAYNLVVKPVEDILVADFVGQDLYVGDEGTGNIYFAVGNNMEVYATMPIVEEGVITGTFTGADGHVELNSSTAYDGCVYNVTITDNGDGTYSVTGTITLPNGARIVFNGETFQQG